MKILSPQSNSKKLVTIDIFLTIINSTNHYQLTTKTKYPHAILKLK